MIDDLENSTYVFLHIIHCHNGIGYEEQIKQKDLNSRMVAEADKTGAYNGILNDLRLNEC